ncbi:38638_t:CDS:2, partial [Gigaspora margarita]
VPGETGELRTKYVKEWLGENKHIKSIKEEFCKGNNWIIVDFDCEQKRDEAIMLSKKKEGVCLNLILEETENKSNNLEISAITHEMSKFPKDKKGYRKALIPQETEIKNQGAEFIMEKEGVNVDKVDLDEWWNIISESILEAARK